MERFLGLILAAAVLTAAFAPAVRAGEQNGTAGIESFAYGFQVEILKEAPFQEVTLPLELYQTVVRRDLGDCAVLDSAQKPVPHAHRAPERPAPSIISKSLPFFPIGARDEGEAGGVSLHFRKAPDGTILDLHSDADRRPQGGIAAYVLDASSLKTPYSALVLKMDPERPSGLVRVRLEGSQDLNGWSPVVGSASVGRLSHQGVTLERDRLELRAARYPYLRLTWDGNGMGLPLLEVQAVLSRDEDANPHHWLRLRTEVENDPSPAYFLDTRGVMPVDRLKVQFPGSNVLVPLTVYSREAEDRPWQYRARATVHRLVVEGSTLSSETVVLSDVVRDRYWKLEVNLPAGSGTAPGQVDAAVGWIPHRLVFLAQGNPPYTLAFGSGILKMEPFPLQGLLDQVAPRAGTGAVVASAGLGPRFVLGGEGKLKPPPPPLPWKRWILWGTLLTGVALMGWMARRLYRQLGSGEQTSAGGSRQG